MKTYPTIFFKNLRGRLPNLPYVRRLLAENDRIMDLTGQTFHVLKRQGYKVVTNRNGPIPVYHVWVPAGGVGCVLLSAINGLPEFLADTVDGCTPTAENCFCVTASHGFYGDSFGSLWQRQVSAGYVPTYDAECTFTNLPDPNSNTDWAESAVSMWSANQIPYIDLGNCVYSFQGEGFYFEPVAKAYDGTSIEIVNFGSGLPPANYTIQVKRFNSGGSLISTTDYPYTTHPQARAMRGQLYGIYNASEAAGLADADFHDISIIYEGIHDSGNSYGRVTSAPAVAGSEDNWRLQLNENEQVIFLLTSIDAYNIIGVTAELQANELYTLWFFVIDASTGGPVEGIPGDGLTIDFNLDGVHDTNDKFTAYDAYGSFIRIATDATLEGATIIVNLEDGLVT